MAIAPTRALLAGGVLYGAGVFWMANYYYLQSSLRSIFVKSDKNYANIKVGHHA